MPGRPREPHQPESGGCLKFWTFASIDVLLEVAGGLGLDGRVRFFAFTSEEKRPTVKDVRSLQGSLKPFVQARLSGESLGPPPFRYSVELRVSPFDPRFPESIDWTKRVPRAEWAARAEVSGSVRNALIENHNNAPSTLEIHLLPASNEQSGEDWLRRLALRLPEALAGVKGRFLGVGFRTGGIWLPSPPQTLGRRSLQQGELEHAHERVYPIMVLPSDLAPMATRSSGEWEWVDGSTCSVAVHADDLGFRGLDEEPWRAVLIRRLSDEEYEVALKARGVIDAGNNPVLLQSRSSHPLTQQAFAAFREIGHELCPVLTTAAAVAIGIGEERIPHVLLSLEKWEAYREEYDRISRAYDPERQPAVFIRGLLEALRSPAIDADPRAVAAIEQVLSGG